MVSMFIYLNLNRSVDNTVEDVLIQYLLIDNGTNELLYLLTSY